MSYAFSNESSDSPSLARCRLLVQYILQLPSDQSVELAEGSRCSLLPFECVSSVLDVLQAIRVVKRVGGEFVHCPSHLLLDFLSSLLPSSTPCCVPSVFDASPAYPAVHGLIRRSDCGFPYAVNPRFYDVPFSPGESPQITQQRLNPAHLPRRVEESSPSLQSAERTRGAALPAALWSTDLFHSALLRRVTTSVVTVLLRDGRVSVERLLSHVASEEVCRAVHVGALLRFIVCVLRESGVVTSPDWDFESLDGYSQDISLEITQRLQNALNARQAQEDEEGQSTQDALSKTQLLCHALLSQSFKDPRDLSPVVNSLFGAEGAPTYDDIEDTLLCSVSRTLKVYKEFLNLSQQ